MTRDVEVAILSIDSASTTTDSAFTITASAHAFTNKKNEKTTLILVG